MLLPAPNAVTFLGGLACLPTRLSYSGIDHADESDLLVGLKRLLERGMNAHLADSPLSATIRMQFDSSMRGSGAYSLLITAERAQAQVEVTARDALGAFYAVQTLIQLRKVYADCIPAQRVDDAPRFATRGVMLDVSRNRIPTMAEFMSIIDTLASLKYNHLQLYTEHTFAYASHGEVWRGFSPLTAEQVTRLDVACRERGIELAANQNCFGHLGSWLNKPAYAHLAETHGDWVFDVWPRSGPFSLCPTDPRSITFVESLLDELLPCFSSRTVNIGCDEVYDIASGRSKEKVALLGRERVYMEFVNSVATACRERGRSAQFWADIALSHPECVKAIPPDLTSLAWGYEPDSPFETWGRLLQGRPFWVCPGTSSWRSLVGRSTERRGNIARAAQHGLTFGATGFLVCDWGDTGHHQQWPITLHALADAAQAAWNPAEPIDLAAESLHLFDDKLNIAAPWLEALGDADLPLRESCGPLSHPSRTRLLNQTAIFIDMFKRTDELQHIGPRAHWFEALDRIDALASRCPTLPNSLMTDELRHTAGYALYAAGRAAFRRDVTANTGIPAATLSQLTAQLAAVRGEHRRLWHVRSRSGGFVQSDGFFDQIEAALLSTGGATSTGLATARDPAGEPEDPSFA